MIKGCKQFRKETFSGLRLINLFNADCFVRNCVPFVAARGRNSNSAEDSGCTDRKNKHGSLLEKMNIILVVPGEPHWLNFLVLGFNSFLFCSISDDGHHCFGPEFCGNQQPQSDYDLTSALVALGTHPFKGRLEVYPAWALTDFIFRLPGIKNETLH